MRSLRCYFHSTWAEETVWHQFLSSQTGASSAPLFVEPRGRLWAPPCSHRKGYTSGCRAVIRRQQSQHPVGSTSLKYLPLAAGVVNFTYSLLTGLPIGRVELCLVSIRLCLVLYASLVVAIPLRLLTRATSFYGCAQHLTWRLQQRTCAPMPRNYSKCPFGTGRSCPLSVCRISRNSWVGRLAPRAPEMRGTCAPRCERDRVCLRMGLAGCPQYQDTSSVTQEEGFWNASVARGVICCFMGGRVLPRAVLTCFPPSDRPHSRHLFPEKEARVGSFSHSPQVRTPQANRVVHPTSANGTQATTGLFPNCLLVTRLASR